MFPVRIAPPSGRLVAIEFTGVHGGSSTLADINRYTFRSRMVARLTDSLASIVMRYRLMLARLGTRRSNRRRYGRSRSSERIGKAQTFLYCALLPLCLLALFL